MQHLTRHGALTGRQQEEARKLGIGEMDYRQVVLKNLAEENQIRVRKNTEKVIVKCNNPIIIIGHGPNWEHEAEKIRGTKIPIIATDVCSIPLMNMGIIPTYIITYESAYKRINESLFAFDKIDKYNVQVIGSKISREWFDKELDKIGMDFYRFTDYETHSVSNVGILGTKFAEIMLKADCAILIGMDSWDDDMGNPYLNWYVDWRKYIAQLPTGFVINCTQGGLLYGGKIIECDYNNLVIK